MIGMWRSVMYSNAVRVAEQLCSEVQQMRDAGEVIHPDQQDILRALQLVTPEQVKVVILGQDPYHGTGQANGLAFSVNAGVKIPPSLRNIFTELAQDIGCEIPVSGDLSKWAEQGVLLLNTVLTVRHRDANSHQNLGWQRVTEEIINVCMELPQPIVFIEWGAFAQRMIESRKRTDVPNKYSIASTHPSPLSAYSASATLPAFIGSKPFSRCNDLLKSCNVAPIDWEL